MPAEPEERPGEHPDEDDLDRVMGGRLPDPLDRVWFHPSELPSAPPTRTASVPSSSTRRPRRAFLHSRWVAAAVGAGTALVAVAMIGPLTSDGDDAKTRSADGVQPVLEQDTTLAQLAAHAAPGIVAVIVRGPDGGRRGSGVCVRHNGEVLTNSRLLDGATAVEVRTSSGTVLDAQVVGRDPTTDLALLTVEQTLPAAPLAVTVALAAGDDVVVIGAAVTEHGDPWMGSRVVASTTGLVGTARGPATTDLVEPDTDLPTDVAGGAVLDHVGTVVGIVMAPVEGHVGGLAVSIDVATDVAAWLRQQGRVPRGWLGLEGKDGPFGATVTRVLDGGPADAAGMRAGDVVEAIADRTVLSMAELKAVTRLQTPGDDVAVRIRRNGTVHSLNVHLASKQSVGDGAR